MLMLGKFHDHKNHRVAIKYCLAFLEAKINIQAPSHIYQSKQFIINNITVSPAHKEPLPGWVDSLNGPIGVMVGGGKGVIRSMLCDETYKSEVIPVDMAISGLITIAFTIGTSKEK